MIKISILYTVYNQSEILKEKIEQFLTLKNENIEFVISDDNSVENIEKLVKDYHDVRIKYYRNNHNLGHDRNILEGLKRCQGEYIFLFRTKDGIYLDGFQSVLDLVENHNDADAFYFSAVDENNNKHLSFQDYEYHKNGSRVAFFEIPAHPSGMLLKAKSLDLCKYESYLTDGKYDFIVHQLIKMDISMNGVIRTSSVHGWVYYNTLSKNDVAQNSTKDGKNVYSPEYAYPRARTLIRFVYDEKTNIDKSKYYAGLVKYLYYEVAYLGIIRCEDYRYAGHYNAKIMSYSMHAVVRQLRSIFFEELDGLDHSSLMRIWLIHLITSIKLLTFYQIKRYVRKFVLTLLRRIKK